MPGLTFPKNPSDGQTASWSFTNDNGIVVNRSWTFDAGTSSWSSTPANLVGFGGGEDVGASIFFSVKDFGAFGDGFNDDTNAILSTVDASIDYGGGIVYFPQGTYRVTDELILSATGSISPSLHILGEGNSSKILVDPTGTINQVFWIYGKYSGGNPQLDWSDISIKGLHIDGNNKAKIGIEILAATAGIDSVNIENCVIKNMKTDSVGQSSRGIDITFVKNLIVQNSRVENIIRNGIAGVCQGIFVEDSDNVLIQNNFVKNVNHGYTVEDADAIDADGIVVFSNRNSDMTYDRQQASILGNTIVDCFSRFIKLQTNGQCLVEGNLFKLEPNSSPEYVLTNDFKMVDSQVANSRIKNNTLYVGTGWTGGSSSRIFELNKPIVTSGLTSYDNHEGFYTTIEDNFINVEKYMPYFSVVNTPSIVDEKSVRVYHTIKNNIANYNNSLTGNEGFGVAVYISASSVWENPLSGASAGEWFFDFHGNNINSDECIQYAVNNSENFTDKHFIKVYENTLPATKSGNVFDSSGTHAYTSTCMIRDNQIGPSAQNTVSWPVDLTRIMSGSDWQSRDQTIQNAPAGTEYSRFSRQGNTWEIQTGQTVYYSSDGINWNSCCNTFASISGNAQASGTARWDYTVYNASYNGSEWITSSPSITAYNLLEVQNTGTTAYGISVTGDRGLTLSGFTGFSVMPVPNGTIVELSYRGGKYFFSAPNIINGSC